MAVLPTTQQQPRRSSRAGAGRRRAHFSTKELERWQQVPRHLLSSVHQAGPLTAAVRQPAVKLTPVRRPTIKSTVQRAVPTQDEIQEEQDELVDLARMPRSFPTTEQ